MFYQIFLAPKVKGCAIITYKLCISELSQELLSKNYDLTKIGKIKKLL